MPKRPGENPGSEQLISKSQTTYICDKHHLRLLLNEKY